MNLPIVISTRVPAHTLSRTIPHLPHTGRRPPKADKQVIQSFWEASLITLLEVISLFFLVNQLCRISRSTSESQQFWKTLGNRVRQIPYLSISVLAALRLKTSFEETPAKGNGETTGQTAMTIQPRSKLLGEIEPWRTPPNYSTNHSAIRACALQATSSA